jgi:hypothetical protein
MSLTRIQRNQVFEAIAASNLDPAECRLEEVPLGSAIYEIRHNDSGSTFIFSEALVGSGLGYRVRYDVHDGNRYTYDTGYEIRNLTPNITRWANEVQLVVGTPDLWAEMRRSRELMTDIQQTDSRNTPFTEDEQRQIAAQLRDIAEQLKGQYELTDEQTEKIDQWRDEATEGSTRLGRKDWRLLVYGSIVNLVLTDVLTPGVARHAFILLVQGIAHLFGGGPPQILS